MSTYAAMTAAIPMRPYQVDTVDEIRSVIVGGDLRIVVVMPTGAGKCVSPDTLVWSNGLRKFEDIWDSDRIEGPHGPARVVGWYDDGVNDGFRVKLECGLEIDGTPAHRVWFRDSDGNEGWRHVGDLQPGVEYVAVARGGADFGDTEIPLDEAYALGLLIADGCVIGTTSQRLQIDKQRTPLEALMPVVIRWKVWAGGNGSPVTISDLSPNHAIIMANAPDFRGMFKSRYGIEWAYCEKRSVPPCVLTGTRDVVRAFLRGYFDGDGYCDKTIAVSTCSSLLADQVHQLLLGLGVFSRRRLKPVKKGLPAHIVQARDVVAFAREVGFTPYGLKKDKSFALLCAMKRNTNIDLVPGVSALIRECARRSGIFRRSDRGMSTSSAGAWRNWDAYATGARKPSYDRLAEFAEASVDCPSRAELRRIVQEHRAWSRVESVTPSRIRRIDCEVEEQHAFIGNGIINHNTVLASHIIRSSSDNGAHVIFVAHRRELIKQAFCKLIRNGISPAKIGVIMGGTRVGVAPAVADLSLTDAQLWAKYAFRNPVASVQVASIDTLRNCARPPCDLLIVDEAHRSLSKGYRELIFSYPKAIVLGLTATPYRADNKGLGEDGLYQKLVVSISPQKLIDLGFLVEPRVFTVPAEELPDLSRVKLVAGDYNQGQLSVACDTPGLVGNAVAHWKRSAGGVRTIVFPVSIVHSKNVVAAFLAEGIPAEHLDGTMSAEIRDAILARLEAGTTLVVASVGVLCEGFDMPSVKCAVLLRSTKSTGLYLQMAGRILRPWNNQGAIILDHAGCTLEHLFVSTEREFSLESKCRSRAVQQAPCRTCPMCFCMFPINLNVCPDCSYEFPAPEAVDKTAEVDGELVEVRPPTRGELKADWDRLCVECSTGGHKPAWVKKQWEEMHPGTVTPKSWKVPAPRATDAQVADLSERGASCLAHGHSFGAAKMGFNNQWHHYPSFETFQRTETATELAGYISLIGWLFRLGAAHRSWVAQERVRVRELTELESRAAMTDNPDLLCGEEARLLYEPTEIANDVELIEYAV